MTECSKCGNSYEEYQVVLLKEDLYYCKTCLQNALRKLKFQEDDQMLSCKHNLGGSCMECAERMWDHFAKTNSEKECAACGHGFLDDSPFGIFCSSCKPFFIGSSYKEQKMIDEVYVEKRNKIVAKKKGIGKGVSDEI